MRVIWKFPLEVTGTQTVMMPDGAIVLDVQEQGERLMLWAMVYDGAPNVARHFAIIGTGNPIPSSVRLGNHVATVKQGPFVWHVFEQE